MPRYAAIENGVVVGVLGAASPPTLNVPRGRVFVDVTEVPEIQGGEQYDEVSGLFVAPAKSLAARVTQIEADIASLKTPKV